MKLKNRVARMLNFSAVLKKSENMMKFFIIKRLWPMILSITSAMLQTSIQRLSVARPKIESLETSRRVVTRIPDAAVVCLTVSLIALSSPWMTSLTCYWNQTARRNDTFSISVKLNVESIHNPSTIIATLTTISRNIAISSPRAQSKNKVTVISR